jgi:hypothetical protein
MREALKVWAKLLGGWALSLVLSLYLTFVLQTLWNWFASPLFRIEISYWNMYGLLLITTVIKLRTASVAEGIQLVKLTTMVEACLPEDKRADTMRLTEESTTAKLLRPAFIDGITMVSATVWLLIGFGVHTFLM